MRDVGWAASRVLPQSGCRDNRSLSGPSKRVGSVGAANIRSGDALMTRTAMSVRLITGAPVALVDHARAERPDLDQVQWDVLADRR